MPIENEPFGLVFAKTVSINSGTGILKSYNYGLRCTSAGIFPQENARRFSICQEIGKNHFITMQFVRGSTNFAELSFKNSRLFHLINPTKAIDEPADSLLKIFK